MPKLPLLLFAALAVLAASCSKPKATQPPGSLTTEVGSADPGAAIRLPTEVSPVAYRIDVIPDLKGMKFAGSVQIDVDVKKPVNTITLNSLELAFSKVTLDGSRAGQATFDADKQTATLDFGGPISVGRHTIAIDYQGKINTFSGGLFALDYDTPEGKRRVMVSQFENADARRFVPSWDEPAAKATFQISITAPGDLMPVSNTPAATSQYLPGGLTKTTFQPTPKMASYLMFLGVGELERIHKMVDGVDVGVVFRKGAAVKAQFALDEAAKILVYYNDYFGVKYPLPKLDLIAGPGEGGFGAMENWGAIFYFESTLLVDPKLSTQSDRQYVDIVIAHEMAHQWFGDLVTMKWWDDLWLNESFAEWMEAKAVDHLHPEWKIHMTEADGRESAMGLDATSATHPIFQPKETVEQMNEIGDSITYEKGAAVIRMLENYVGETAWRDGVRAYMKEHAYSNTTHDDLWRAVEAAAHKPVLQVAREFTEQAGVPMVRVDEVQGVSTASSVAVRQDRFGLDQFSKAALLWHVPVTAKGLGSSLIGRGLISGPSRQVLPVPGGAPIIVNPDQVGYFRTLYAAAPFQALSARFADLEPFDQLTLIQDTWALAESGDAPASNSMDLLSELPADAYPLVWNQAAETLADIDDYYIGLGARQEAFRAFGRRVLAPALAKIGWDAKPGEPAGAAVAREELIVVLGLLNDPQTVAEARRRFALFQKDPSALPAGLRKPVLNVVARHADAATFDAIFTMAKAAVDSQEKSQDLRALARVEDPALAQKYMDRLLTPDVPSSLAPRLLRALAVNHVDMAWQFAVAHKAQIDALLDSSARLEDYTSLLSGTSDVKYADMVHAFALQNYSAGGRRPSDKVEASIRHRAEVKSQRLPEIDRWLAAHGAAQRPF